MLLQGCLIHARDALRCEYDMLGMKQRGIVVVSDVGGFCIQENSLKEKAITISTHAGTRSIMNNKLTAGRAA